MASLAIWTVGHSNHAFADLARMLDREHIEVVVDVRSFPYSRIAPQFNRDEFASSLRSHGLRYLFLGEDLGGRPTRDDHYDADGHALYGSMSRTPEFAAAIRRLVDGAADHRIALVCSEGKPQDCHRRLLVGKVLAEHGVELRHILPDGTVRAERTVELGATDQATLFDEDVSTWRSTQSVSHRRRLSTSSAG